jgi:hypothetical protein
MTHRDRQHPSPATAETDRGSSSTNPRPTAELQALRSLLLELSRQTERANETLRKGIDDWVRRRGRAVPSNLVAAVSAEKRVVQRFQHRAQRHTPLTTAAQKVHAMVLEALQTLLDGWEAFAAALSTGSNVSRPAALAAAQAKLKAGGRIAASAFRATGS